MSTKMKLFIQSVTIFFIIFSQFIHLSVQNQQPQSSGPSPAPAPAQTPTVNIKTLTYNIAEDDKAKLMLKLSGSDYTSTKCYMKKSANDGETYEEINTCPGNAASGADGKCFRPCVQADNKLNFDQFSPRTKYVVVFTGDNAEGTVTKTQGGTVFGLELPLLVNPQVTITTTDKMKLKLSTVTCANVNCPIFYKGVKYQKGTAGNSCLASNSENEVEFDLMVPQYEMICENYPSFFYTLQNKYTLAKSGIYQPQYYVKFNNIEKTKYLIKFTNKYPFEICRFSIKEESVQVSADTSNEYTSNCGGKQDCYAPCNDVELTFTRSKAVVEVMIQSRHFTLGKDKGKYYGYIQKKFVITEPKTAGEALLSNYKKNSVTLNAKLFNPEEDPKFSTCAVTHYEADKPAPTEGGKAKCGGDSKDCANTCESALTITELSSGKPYIIVIAASSTAGIPAGFKEHIFIRTENEEGKTFSSVSPTLGETNASIKAIADDKALKSEDITCSYYVSLRDKGLYASVECVDSSPCRGYCKETQNIIGLLPGTDYDLKVVAHKDYGFKVHQITTGILSTPDPTATCHYNLHVKAKGTYELVDGCLKIPINTKLAKQSTLKSLIYKTALAKLNSGNTTLLSSINNSSPPTSCTEPPLCSDISFTNNYDRTKIYRVTVSTVIGSSEAIIDIPENPLPKNSDPNKKLIINIKREGSKLKITSKLPPGMEESFCGWELRSSTNTEKSLVNSCNGENDRGCESFPNCKEFEIENVENTIDYHLSVYVSSDPSVNESKEIKKGDTYDTMKSTSTNMIIIIASSVVGVVVLAAIVVIYIKKRN